MSKYTPDMTNRGNYKCPYCTHKVWKRYAAAERHIDTFHPDEVAKAKSEEKLQRLESMNKELSRQLEEAKKPKEIQYYDASIYCAVCMRVWTAGVPQGQTFADTPCSTCGNCTLHRVNKID